MMLAWLKQAAKKNAMWQMFSYALFGALINLVGYAFYLLLTYLGSTPKLTMTALYSIGALVGFVANRRITFRHRGHIGAAGLRYLLAQLMGYLLNLLLLLVFVDWLGFEHRVVQGTAIIAVAVFLFFLSRFFVFPRREPDE